MPIVRLLYRYMLDVHDGVLCTLYCIKILKILKMPIIYKYLQDDYMYQVRYT